MKKTYVTDEQGHGLNSESQIFAEEYWWKIICKQLLEFIHQNICLIFTKPFVVQFNFISRE